VITVGSMTLLDHLPYTCIKIEDGVAYLKKVGEESRGRYRKMDVKLVPFVDEKNQLITPKPPPVNRKRMTRFHYMKTIKEQVDMPISHDLAYIVAEHLESLVMMLADRAETNAEEAGDDRITAAHWYWLELEKHEGFGKWPENRELAKDYKMYLRNENV
jgi:hypothetical protein